MNWQSIAHSTVLTLLHGLTLQNVSVRGPIYIYVCIYPVTMVSVGYHRGLAVIYPQFELAVRHFGINHYYSLSLMSNHFSCLPISHS